MLLGIGALIGRATAATRALAKISAGQNPMQTFEFWIWLKQNFLGAGAGEAVSEGRSSGASQSIMDQMNRQAPQSARQPPPPNR